MTETPKRRKRRKDGVTGIRCLVTVKIKTDFNHEDRLLYTTTERKLETDGAQSFRRQSLRQRSDASYVSVGTMDGTVPVDYGPLLGG